MGIKIIQNFIPTTGLKKQKAGKGLLKKNKTNPERRFQVCTPDNRFFDRTEFGEDSCPYLYLFSVPIFSTGLSRSLRIETKPLCFILVLEKDVCILGL
jgi:hypothetical protein